jgi:hypothetical protein
MLAKLSAIDLNLSGHTNTNISLLSAKGRNLKENGRISWLNLGSVSIVLVESKFFYYSAP